MLCRVPKLRHSAKSLVAECRIRQSMTLGKEPLCQVSSTQHSLALSSLPSPSHSAHLCNWQRVTVVHTIILCRVPQADTRQNFFYFLFFAFKLFHKHSHTSTARDFTAADYHSRWLPPTAGSNNPSVGPSIDPGHGTPQSQWGTWGPG